MLTSLFIQNLAVVEKLYIEFTKGMNVFTGETGAGKSIVIDAISAILGGRCSKGLVRNGANKAVIVGTFQEIPENIRKISSSYGIDLSNDELIIQREILMDGKSIARIDGRPVTIGFLREIGCHLIHIHGQHDNQILLSPENHIDILDCYGELESILEGYQESFKRLTQVKNELEQFRKEQNEKKATVDVLYQQIEEIEEANLTVGEDIRLENEATAIKNGVFITNGLHEAYQNIHGSEESQGAIDQLHMALTALERTSQYYLDVNEIIERLREAYYLLEETGRDIGVQLNSSDFNPAKLDFIEARLDTIFQLKKKYGNTIQDILETLNQTKEELEQIEMYDVRLNERIVEQKRLSQRCQELCAVITEKRKEAAKKFVTTVTNELRFLEMKGVQLEIRLTPCKQYAKGCEQILFLISTNIGEPPKPLAKVASGGELSRIMLAIKSTMADKDKIATIVFDEIDTGVSGIAAQKIGLKMKQVSSDHQIFCVTHLAQIAAMADTHFKLSKAAKSGRTYTTIERLNKEERIEEIARIMSTGDITPLMRKTAEEIINKALKM